MKRILFLFLMASAFLTGCTLQSSTKTTAASNTVSISIANWNLQEFFDAQTDGTEYSDFKSNARWSSDKYLVRLHRACETITALNADIFVFEEIENEGILYDLSNQLCGNSWDNAKIWSYGAFCKEDGSAIGCAIFSKFPLENIKTHAMDIRTQSSLQPSVRPVLETTITVNGKQLKIFANHWKSKSGGEEESEIWRDWQEFVAANAINSAASSSASRAQAAKSLFILSGDFNRSAEDFCINLEEGSSASTCNTIFRGLDNIKVFNPWFYTDGSFTWEKGTYWYNSSWERIDNFFGSENIKITGFSPKTGGWTNSDGTPNGYKIYTGEGYSDHLPIMCTISF